MSPLYVPTRYQQGDVTANDPRDIGLLGQTFDPGNVGSSTLTLVTGFNYMFKAWVPRTVTATNMWFGLTSVGATLTAGANNLAIYNSAGTQLCATADQTTNFTATTGYKSVAFTSPTVVPGGPGVFVWLSVKSTGTTPITLSKWGGPLVNPFNFGLIAATYRCATNGSNTAALLPSSITPSSNASIASYCWLGFN